MWKQMPCPGLIVRNVMRLFRLIQFRQLLQLQLLEMWLGILNPFRVVKTIDSLFLSISDTPAISKANTRSFRQSHLTCPESKLPVSKTVTKLDNSSHPEVVTDHLKNEFSPKCMTKLDWVEAQSKDKIIGEIIQLFKVKDLQCGKGKETDSNEMRKFIIQ